MQDIQAGRERAMAATLDEAVRKKVEEVYTQAAQELSLAAEAAKTAADFEAAKSAAAARLEDIKCQLAIPVADPSSGIPPDAKLSDLEQLKNAADVELVTAQKARSQLQTVQNRTTRRGEVAALSAAATKELEQLQAQFLAAPAANEAPELTAANRLLLAARRHKIQKQIASYEKELLSYDAVGNELLKLENDKAKRDEEAAQRKAIALANILNEQRRILTEREAAEARRAAAGAHPSIRELADQNRKLAELRSELAAKMQDVSARLSDAKKSQKNVADKFSRVQKQVTTAAIGQLLRKHRTELPDLRQLHQQCDARQIELSEVQLQLFDLKDDDVSLTELDARTAAVLAGIAAGGNPSDGDLYHEVYELLVKEDEIREALIVELSDYDRKLVELDEQQRKLIAETEQYAGYIDQRVLWIRSTTALAPSDVEHGWGALQWLTNAQAWTFVIHDMISATAQEPVRFCLAAMVLVPMLVLRKRLGGRLESIGALAEKSHVTDIRLTFRALLITAVLASLWPALLWLIAWRMQSPQVTSELASSVAFGLQSAAGLFLALAFFRHLSRSKGLAESHFGWPLSSLRVLRKHLHWLLLLGVPVAFVVGVVEAHGNDPWRNSLGRWAFVVGQIALALFMQRVMRPAGGALHQTIAFRRGGWLDRLSNLWYPLLVGAPACLAVLASAGFYYTALRLNWCLQATICLMMTLLVFNSFMTRWLMLARRKLAMQQARQRRAAAQAEAKDAGQTVSMDSTSILLEEHGLDLSDIDVQTRRLLQSSVVLALVLGSAVIWANVLPALGIFKEVMLWRDSGTGEAVTLMNLAMAVILVVMTIIAGRNFPGLMEISILQRLPLEPAIRYATTTVSKYVIVIVGMVVAFSVVGVSWAKVQWLVAAVTFGLGFGLQEIFANFVSGLIILFERPVRVGDTVTVGEVSGVVSRIRMRATTITDGDRKELIVPNKEFITGRLVNWTLTDPTLRVVIPVGVAYGTDTDLVGRLLLQVAAENPIVLRDPAPNALLVGFGESTLNFELRVFVPSVESYLPVRHDLNTRILRLFDEANIEIAYPHREIHIRSSELRSSGAEGEPLADSAAATSMNGSVLPSQQKRVA